MTAILLSLDGLLRTGAPLAEGDGHADDDEGTGFTTDMTAEPQDAVALPLLPPVSGGRHDPLRHWLEENAGISAELADISAPENTVALILTDVAAGGDGAAPQGPGQPVIARNGSESGPSQVSPSAALRARAEADIGQAPAITTDLRSGGSDLPAPAQTVAGTPLAADDSPAAVRPPDAASPRAGMAPSQEQPQPVATATPPLPDVSTVANGADPAAHPVQTSPVTEGAAPAPDLAQAGSSPLQAAPSDKGHGPVQTGSTPGTAADSDPRTDSRSLAEARPRTDWTPIPVTRAPSEHAQTPAQVAGQVMPQAVAQDAAQVMPQVTPQVTAQPAVQLPPDPERRPLEQAMPADGLAAKPYDDPWRKPVLPNRPAQGPLIDAEHGPEVRPMRSPAMAELPATPVYGLEIRSPAPVRPDFVQPASSIAMIAHDELAATAARVGDIAELFISPGGMTGPTGREAQHTGPGRPEGAAPVLRQIGEALLTTRSGVTELVLAPEELGRLRMTITGQERPQLVFWAERPETMELLRRNIEQLSAELQEAGVDAGMLDFRDEPPPRAREQAGDDDPADQRDGSGMRQSVLAVPAPLAIGVARPQGARRIDVRL
jgi:flagellar hook-length control protein FliK